MSKQKCKTNGCDGVAKSRGICSKCYGTLRVLVRKGKLTWDQAVASGLCDEARAAGPSVMADAVLRAQEAGLVKLSSSMQTPQLDADEEPPAVVLPTQPTSIPERVSVSIKREDPSPHGYGRYDPNAPAAADAPAPPKVPIGEPALESRDEFDIQLDNEDYDEDPAARKRRRAIERKWKEEQRLRYIAENGIEPPSGGQVVVVPPPATDYQLNDDPNQLVTGAGAGNELPSGKRPGVYVQQHAAPAPPTIDGEPLLPGWSIAPDGQTLVSPTGQLITADAEVAAAPAVPATPAVPTPPWQTEAESKVVGLLGPDGQPMDGVPAVLSKPTAQVPTQLPPPPDGDVPPRGSSENTGLIPRGPEPMGVDKSDGEGE